MTTEKQRESSRRWREAHKAQIAENRRRYYEEHKAHSAEYMRRYREAHKAQIAENRRRYYEEHKAQMAEKDRRYRKEHPLYAVWTHILERTGLRRGASRMALKYYRDRGITVCDEWQDFKRFEEWALSHGWKKGLQIDRINNNGNYEPSNCRFVTCKENCRNRRNTNICTYRGERMPLIEAYEKSGCQFPYFTIYIRVHRLHWEIERALTEPVRNKGVKTEEGKGGRCD